MAKAPPRPIDDEPEDNPDDGLSIDLDFEGIEDEKDLALGIGLPVGSYHVEVDEVRLQTKEGKTPAAVFTFRALEGEPDDDGVDMDKLKNRTYTEYLYLSEKTIPRQRLFAFRLGLVGKKSFGKKARVNFEDAAGAQCVIKLIEVPDGRPGFEGKTQIRMDYNGIFAVDDEDVASVPKDKAAMKAAGKTQARKPQSNFDDLA